MSKALRTWTGSNKFNENVRLIEHQYDDGSIHYTFYPRVGAPGNPSKAEADEIVKSWRLVLAED